MKINHPKKVCVVSTVHKQHDARIFYKEAKSLLTFGYDVDLVISSNDGGLRDGINLVPLPKAKTRITRFACGFYALRLCLIKKYDIYHFHDPELIFIALILKLITWRPVVYDVHENYADAILVRPWIYKRLRKFIAFLFSRFEVIAAGFFDSVIFADEGTEGIFKAKGIKRTIVISNFPILAHFKGGSAVPNIKEKRIAYVGKIVPERGVWEILQAFRLATATIPDLRLDLVGDFDSKDLENKVHEYIMRHNLMGRITLFGFLPNDEICTVLNKTMIGMVVVDQERFKYNVPTKIFEYMLSKNVVIASRTKSIEKYIIDNYNGVLVNNNDPEEIASKILYLLGNEDASRLIMDNALSLVNERYNWERESQKLKYIYSLLV